MIHRAALLIALCSACSSVSGHSIPRSERETPEPVSDADAEAAIAAAPGFGVDHSGSSATLATTILEEAPAAAEQPEDEHAEPFERHTVSVLTRVVTEERAEGGPAFGLDYEYRFSERWGAGGFAEYVAGELEVGVFGALANFHPVDRLAIGIGPGIETGGVETRGLMRLGGLYEFEAGEIVVAPAIYWDWLEGGNHVFLMGLNFGKKF